MEILYITLLTFVAALVGTVTGFGTSTLMIPVLASFFPPVQVLFFVGIIHFFGDMWKVALFRKGFNMRLFLLFGGAGVAASFLGASVSLGANEIFLLRLLGGFLITYALFLFFQSSFRIPAGNTAAVAGGGLSGFFAGMFGIGGAVRSTFLSAFDLPKAVYIATGGAIGLLVDFTRLATYIAGGAGLSAKLWYGLLLFIPVSFAGARLARGLVGKIPQEKFRTVIAVFLFFAGAKLVFWP